MIAGRLDRRLELLRATVVTDDFGGETKAWATLATVWASKADVSDAERARAQQIGASVTTRFQIRWALQWGDLTALDRVACDGRTYDVVAVKEIGRREGLEITATARADAAP